MSIIHPYSRNGCCPNKCVWAEWPTEAVRAIPDQEGKDDGRVLRAVGRLKDDIIHSLSSVLAKGAKAEERGGA